MDMVLGMYDGQRDQRGGERNMHLDEQASGGYGASLLTFRFDSEPIGTAVHGRMGHRDGMRVWRVPVGDR